MDIREMKLGVFSDTTDEYVKVDNSASDGSVTVKIRVPARMDITEIMVIAGDEVSMKKGKREGCFRYYSATFTITEDVTTYHFMIGLGSRHLGVFIDDVAIYDATGLHGIEDTIVPLRLIPGMNTPDWAKGAIFYQIFVDRFCNGDKSNDVLDGEYKYIGTLTTGSEWGTPVSESGIGQFYGGDLQGVIEKLDYLKNLGVDVIYLNPVFVSPSNHKYDTQDYDYIDPHFGVIRSDEGEILSSASQDNSESTKYINRVTNPENLEASNELFARLVKEAHNRGMKVILDGVFNHCGSFNRWMDTERIYDSGTSGAYCTEKSEFHEYFSFSDDSKWPDEVSYNSWWGFDTLPKLNYNSEKLYKEILRIAAKWVSEPYNADGWRLDVAADLGDSEELNHRFWSDFRKAVREANPEAIIIAEHYGDPSSWLKGGEWDTVMNYDAFMEPLTWFLTGMQKHSDEYREELLCNTAEFWKSMQENGARFSAASLFTAMNELSNHDHSRFLTRTSHTVGRYDKLGAEAAAAGVNKAVMREAVLVQMTWPGAPTIYYGDEAGVTGFTDPDNRRCYPWGSEDMEMIGFHKLCTRMHKHQPELSRGSLMRLPSAYGVLSYARVLGSEASVVIINNLAVAVEVEVPVWSIIPGKGYVLGRVVSCDSDGYDGIYDINEDLTLVQEESGKPHKARKVRFKERIRCRGTARVVVGPYGGKVYKVHKVMR